MGSYVFMKATVIYNLASNLHKMNVSLTGRVIITNVDDGYRNLKADSQPS